MMVCSYNEWSLSLICSLLLELWFLPLILLDEWMQHEELNGQGERTRTRGLSSFHVWWLFLKYVCTGDHMHCPGE